MPGPSDYAENNILDHVFHSSASFTKPTGPLVLALFTDVIADDGTGTELSGDGYSRQTVTFATQAAAGSIANTNEITFTASGGDWGTINSAAIYDNGGNFLWGGPLDAGRIVNDGDSLKFGIGDIVISLA